MTANNGNGRSYQTALQRVQDVKPLFISFYLLRRIQVHLGSGLLAAVGRLTTGLVQCCYTLDPKGLLFVFLQSVRNKTAKHKLRLDYKHKKDETRRINTKLMMPKTHNALPEEGRGLTTTTECAVEIIKGNSRGVPVNGRVSHLWSSSFFVFILQEKWRSDNGVKVPIP